MKRRNFLKATIGLPVLSTTLCSAKSLKKVSQKSLPYNVIPINYDNIKINGTFEEWVNSMAKEIERLLATKSKEPDADWFGLKYNVEVIPSDWSSKQDGSIPALAVCIDIGKHHLGTHFAFAKCEWDRNRKNPKALQSIFHCRYIDFIWSLYDVVREQVILLKKLDIDCSKSLNEYGAI